LYTVEEAREFIDNTIKALIDLNQIGTELTYQSAVQYVANQLKLLTPEAQALFIVLQDFMTVDFGQTRLLSDFDIGMLIRHLNDQKIILAPFLLKG